MILTRREAPGRVHPQARRDRLLSHSSRQDLEPTVRQALIGYVGFAASISATPPAAMGRMGEFGPVNSSHRPGAGGAGPAPVPATSAVLLIAVTRTIAGR
jgi:hypothetical protein